MPARSIGELEQRASNLALLNEFLSKVHPLERRKRAIMVLWENEIISGGAAELLIEHNQLEAA